MKLNLSLQMFIATFLGIGCGLFIGDYCAILAPAAKAYIMILKITAVPYLIVAIMKGIGQLLPQQSVSIFKKGLFVIIGVWAINLLMIFLTTSVFPQGSGSRIASYNPKEPPAIKFADLLIPENIFADLAGNVVPSIVVFSLLLGIAIMHTPSKSSLLFGLDLIQSLLTKVTSWIAKLTPYGTFVIIANQFGTIDLSTIQQVSTYIILYITCLALVSFWIVPKLVSTFTTISSRIWIKTLSPILLLAYTTNFVIVCLPFLIIALEKLLKEKYEVQDPKTLGEVQGLVSLIFNIPLGSLFISVFVIFLSVMYHAPFDLGAYTKLFLTTFLTSLGAVGMGAWLNSLSFLLASFMLPEDSIHLFLTSLPFTSGFQSMVSLSQIGMIALFVTLLGLKALKFESLKITKGLCICFIPLLLFFHGLKVYNPFPPIESRSKSIYDLSIFSSVPITLCEAGVATSAQNTLAEIKKNGVIRVGYSPKQAPFSFKNSYGELVGFDIAFAHQLAYDLNCRLELVPLSYQDLLDETKLGLYDIGMSAISMNESRIQKAYFTKPYLASPIIFLLTETHKKRLKNSEFIFGDPTLKIGAVKGTCYEELLPKLFPNHTHILLDSYDAFATSKQADLLIWSEYEASCWILKHKNFRVLFPSPAIGQDTLCYLLKQGDNEFLEFMNNWLILKENEGFFSHQFNLWIKGKTSAIEPKERRWSFIKDVMHWDN